MLRRQTPFLALSAALLLSACGGAQTRVTAAPTDVTPPVEAPTATAEAAEKQAPPASAAPREIQFPKIERSVLPRGLELNTVPLQQLPTVSIKLAVRSGSADDPKQLIGLAHLVSSMLKEGTKSRTSAEIAEQVDFLGAHLWVDNDEEHVYINMRALSEHFDEALSLVADLAINPRFSGAELNKLKARELDRLSLRQKDPNFLVYREFFKQLYGDHPYANVDTNEAVVKRVRSADLRAWHGKHFVPNNAVLVVAGDVSAEAVQKTAKRAFRGWKRGKVSQTPYPAPPERTQRGIVLIDRPESVQSVIFVGNLALSRRDPDYIPLLVANQVLGGSAASRLFMDLREKQSLTYGAYSRVYESVGVAPFRAYAAVRNEVTAQALAAFMGHLDGIVGAVAPEPELANAKRFLVDRFPLRIDTTDKIAGLVLDLRVYDLPDTYWDGFRGQISQVTADAALEAARKYIQPNASLLVVVGKAAAVKDALAKYGPVTVVDTQGKVVVEAAAAPTPPAPIPPAPIPPAPAPQGAAPAASEGD